MKLTTSYFYSCICKVSKLPGGVCIFHCQVLVIYKSMRSVSTTPCAIQSILAAREKREQVRVTQLRSWLCWGFGSYNGLRNRSPGKMWCSKPIPSSGYPIEGNCSPVSRGTGEEGPALNPQTPGVKSLSPSQPSVEITFDPWAGTVVLLPLFLPSCHLKSWWWHL